MAVKKKRHNGMYGANEKPRLCPRCKASETVVKHTKQFTNPGRVVRYRECQKCNQRFTTNDVKNRS